MGQATHPLMLHVGKSQLWEWGSSVLHSENLYAWQTRRTLLGTKYILNFLSGLLIIHSSHIWAPKYWTGGSMYRQKKHTSSSLILHVPNLIKQKIRRRYYRYTPRRSGFSDGENFFYEFAMNRRWSFFKLYAWGNVHIFRFNSFVVVCCGGVPISTGEKTKKTNIFKKKQVSVLKKYMWF